MQNISDIEQRVYIKMRTALKINAASIHQELVDILGDNAYSYRTVADWSRRFKDGRVSVEDDPRQGRPSTTLTKANIQLVEKLIDEDSRISYRSLVELTSLNLNTIHKIIHDHLHMKKKKSRWIPHKLTPENKQKRLTFANLFWPHVHSNVHNFLKSKGMKTIDHPPYSPDLAPCDYWLFDYIKDRLDDEINAETLATSITNIVSSIPHSEYCKTFKKYIERLELCVLAEGDYFEHFMK